MMLEPARACCVRSVDRGVFVVEVPFRVPRRPAPCRPDYMLSEGFSETTPALRGFTSPNQLSLRGVLKWWLTVGWGLGRVNSCHRVAR